MKLSVLLLTATCLQVSAGSYAQQVTLNKNNISLEKVFEQIYKQTGYQFVYTYDVLKKAKKINIDAGHAPLDKVLKACFRDQPFTYRAIGNAIIVKRKDKPDRQPEPALIPIEVKGKVTDSLGHPLIGVTIKVKGGGTGGVTDAQGRYTVDVRDDAILEVSYIGYEAQEIPVQGRAEINIVLRQAVSSLNQLVVVGYGVQKKRDITGSIATITSKDLTQAPVTDVTNTLAGRLPGLVAVQSTGEPGFDGSSLNIRGFGSPLIIVDGVESSLNNIDPGEIASVSILKDASAAVYGARAGNGVILVTTKSGGLGKPTVRLNSTYSLQTYTIFPQPLNAGQYTELMREAELNSGTPENSIRYSEEEVQKYKQGTEPGYQSTNWWDAIMNDYYPLQKHSLSVSGGSDAIKYYTFLGYTGQTGMYKSGDNKFQRYNLLAKVDGKVNKNLTVSTNISAVFGNINSPSREQTSLWQDFYSLSPTLPARLPDPAKIPYGGTIVSTQASTDYALGGYDKRNDNQVSASLSAKYDIPGIKGLYLDGMVNYLQNTAEEKKWIKAYSQWEYEPSNDTYIEYPSARPTALTKTYSKSRTITARAAVNFERTFAEVHNVSAMFLTEVSDYAGSWFSAGRSNYITTSIDYLFAGGGEGQTSNGAASESGRLSYVGRINYAFKQKYLLETTMRYDGSPKFPVDKRWGFFPSVSAGWIITEEPFIENSVTWLDNLKLRISLSNTGYDGIGAFQYLTGYNFGNTFIANDEIRKGLISTGLANPDITWENMTIYNVGLDFSVWQRRLYGTLDGFYRYRKNILASRILSLPNTFGATLPLENINSMNNRGFEVMLGYRNKTGDFSYDISGNISYTRAKWVHYEEPQYTDPDDIRVHKVSGNWVNKVFGYVADGLFTSSKEIEDYPLDQDGQGNQTLLPGDIKYVDQNGDKKLDWRDERPIGLSNQPEIMFGLNVSLKYKNIDLSALFQGAAKRSVLLSLGVENFGNQKDVLYNSRWTEQNNDQWAIVPRQYMGGKINNTYKSTYWLKGASYGRLKTLNVGYNFPKQALDRLGIENVRIYFAGTNLLTVSGLLKYNIDPESPSGIKSGNYYPQQKVYSIGLNLSF